MFYIIALLQNNISFFTNRLKKTSALISMIVIVYLLRGTDSRTTLDYNVYQSQYTANSDYFESGYNFLTHIANNFGLPYQEFRLLFATFGALIFFMAVNRHTKHPELAIFCYMLAALPADLVQIRQFVMISFTILGYSFFKKSNFVSFVMGEIVVFLGTQFHSLGWIFVLLAPLIFMKANSLRKLLGISIVLFTIFTAAFYVIPSQYLLSFTSKIIVLLSSRSDIGQNVANVYSNSAGLFVIAIMFSLSMIAAILLYRVQVKESVSFSIKALHIVIFVMLISVLLAYMSIDYVRLLRSAFVFYFVLLSNLVTAENKRRLYSYMLLMSLLMLYLQVGVVYQTNGRLLPYILHFKNQNIIQ